MSGVTIWRTSARRIASLVSLVLALHPMTAAADDFVHYYCPRGNAQLNGNDHHLTGVAVTPYPLRLGPAADIQSSKTLYWELSDCSDKQFLCLEAQALRSNRSFRIFTPRLIEPGATYKLGSAIAVAMDSTSNSERSRAQLVIRQEIAGKGVSFKITLEEKRGIVFFDGIDFWGDTEFSSSGETCALESRLGYFSEVKILPSSSKHLE
jgi:hypothetical protein